MYVVDRVDFLVYTGVRKSFSVERHGVKGYDTQSDSGCLIYQSIPVLNAAKPPPPSNIACGPALLANIAPASIPAPALLYRSFFALKLSMTHSQELKSRPILPKFFADDQDRAPMSLKPRLSCSFIGSFDSSAPCGVRGVS